MAFHSGRGTPRGRGFSGGVFRGRNRRGGKPGGGSQGRGAIRRSRAMLAFGSSRLAEVKNMDAETSREQLLNASEDGDDHQSHTSSEEDEEENLPTTQPYNALLQSLTVDVRPPSKKRRLDNAQIEHQLEDEMIEEDKDIDRVEEPEEGPETAVEGLLEEAQENEEAILDPFEIHFANPDEKALSQGLEAIQQNQWITRKKVLPELGNILLSTPGNSESADAWVHPVVSSSRDLRLKSKLAILIEKQRPSFDSLERHIAPLIFTYSDILYCERTPAKSESLRRLACLHAVNHVFKTRDRVIKNNARLAKEEHNDSLDLRDQGFTRPKILILLPTRESCVKMVNMILSLCEPEQQENRKRFDDSYAGKEEEFSFDQPEDFRELFSGNDDDMFRLGMKFTRKAVKYFAQFYNSDIIFASPLGLRMAIGTDENKKVDHDFLSSIEIVIVDQADALLMQNWEHVEFIFECLNLQPKETHGCDFSRVRNWYLDNNARYFRQAIALCSFNTPELNTLFYNRSQNWAGKIKIQANYPGVLQELNLKVKQTFSRVESPSFSTDPDNRFNYFTTAIIPLFTRHSKDIAGTLIFIPSYLDFVRVRNYFINSATTSSLSFGIISEYTSVTEVARARSHFLTGRHSVLLYTERAHHFRRYILRGVRKVIMYGLPDNPIFFKEIVGGYLGRSTQEGKLEPDLGTLRVLFSKWDLLKLERVAGTERVSKMIREKGDTFDFV